MCVQWNDFVGENDGIWCWSLWGPSQNRYLNRVRPTLRGKLESKKLEFFCKKSSIVHPTRNQNSSFEQKLEFSGCKSRQPDKLEMSGCRLLRSKKLEFWNSKNATACARFTPQHALTSWILWSQRTRYISWTYFYKMNMGCQLSVEALRRLLIVTKHSKLRKQRALQISRSSKGRRYKVDRKAPNERRDRWLVLQKIARMSDHFFKRYFRMDRATFRDLLETIAPQIARNEDKANNGSGPPIHPVGVVSEPIWRSLVPTQRSQFIPEDRNWFTWCEVLVKVSFGERGSTFGIFQKKLLLLLLLIINFQRQVMKL